MRALSAALAAGIFCWSTMATAVNEDDYVISDYWWDRQADSWTLGGSFGTTGFGFEVAYAFNDDFSLRGALRWGNISFDVEADQIDYDGELKLGGGFLFADFTPFKWKGMTLTVGVSANKFDFESDARCENPAGCRVGNTVFLPAVLGELSADIDFNNIAPYAGIGIGTPLHRKKRGFHFRGELGLMFTGTPDADVSSNSAACNANPACVAALREEEDDIEDDAKFFVFYPVVNFLFGYTF